MIRKSQLFSVLAVFFMIFISQSTYAQLRIIHDDHSRVDVDVEWNYIIISGNVLNHHAPSWQSLILVDLPPCATIDLIYEWDCLNPERGGYLSRSYYKILKVTFDDGCEGSVTIRLKEDPNRGQRTIPSDKNYHFSKVEIQDNCGNPINSRQILDKKIDPEEEIKFYVRAWSNDPNFNFPPSVSGFITSNCRNEIEIPFRTRGNGFAEYYTDAKCARGYVVNGIEHFPDEIRLIFETKYEQFIRYEIQLKEVPFQLKSIYFADTIPLLPEYDGITACYPWGAHVALGAKVKVMKPQWPLHCQPMNAKIKGLRNGVEFTRTAGRIYPDSFSTAVIANGYPIGPIYQEDLFNGVFRLAVDFGPFRHIFNDQRQIRIFHGFMADTLRHYGPLATGDTVFIFSNTKPRLKVSNNDRIRYHWYVETINGGQGHFVGQDSRTYWGKFIADAPGMVRIRYDVYDSMSVDTWAISDWREISIEPHLIITPLVEDRFCFNDSLPGRLYVGPCHATTGNLHLDSTITWSITNIVGSSLTPPAPGQNANFIFTGLPDSNNQFGSKVIRADLPGYNMSDFIAARMFYLKDRANYPNAVMGAAPNWFYYWQNGVVVPNMNSVFYDAYVFSPGYYDPNKDTVYIGANSSMEINDYDIPPFPYHFQHKSGIDLCAITVAHEKYHQEIDNNWRPPYGKWFVAYGLHPFWYPNVPPNEHDPDGDLLPTEYEDSISTYYGFFQLNPDSADTYHVHLRFPSGQDYDIHGDNELMARFLNDDKTGAASNDWSHGIFSKQW